MKRQSILNLGILLLVASACSAGPEITEEPVGQTTPEAVASKAETRFREYLGTRGTDRKAATEQTASYLKTLPGIKEVRVSGSDSLFVIMNDGNEVMLMLGRDRL